MALDPIEAEMTDGGADVVYREKIISRGVAGTGFGLGAFASIATIAATQNGEIGATGAVIGGVVSLALLLYGIVASVTRIAVTRSEIRIVIGGRTRIIPLSAITTTEVYAYRGGPPAAVIVKWTAGRGVDRFAIPSADPNALSKAIDIARANVRVGAAVAAGAERDVETEEREEEEADAGGQRTQAR